jgi:hypothetical protein
LKSRLVKTAMLLFAVAAFCLLCAAEAGNNSSKSVLSPGNLFKINFNSEQSLGGLSWYIPRQNPNLTGEGSNIISGTNAGSARGIVTLTRPDGDILGLFLGPYAITHPEALDRITPNNVEGLLFKFISSDAEDLQRATNVIRHLRGFIHLKEFGINMSDISDAQLAELPVFNSLERFDADFDLLFTGEELHRLAHCAHLRSLSLQASSIKGTNLALLKDFKNLEYLSFSQTHMQGQLKYLPACPSLKHLSLNASQLSDDDLIHLRRLKNLEVLDLSNCRISDKGLPALAGLKRLKELGLAATGVTISSVIELVKNMHLARLTLTDREFAAEDKRKLAKYCPSIEYSAPPHVKIPTRETQRMYAPVSRRRGL